MKKSNFLLIFLLACSIFTYALPVDKERATNVANSFLQKASLSNGQKRAPRESHIIDANNSEYNNKFYLFNISSGGFIIVSADDTAYPILGYSTTNSLDSKNIPSNVKAWLDLYADEINYATDSGLVQSEEIKKQWANIESYSNAAVIVSPLILTRWNQSPYYNDLCPMDNAKNERTVTGCVATAMAQVLKYWEYPINGNGYHSYTHTHGQQSADFANTTYDWNNMPLELISTSSDTEKATIAQLMYHCGVSVEMDYGIASTGGSGAFTISSKSNSTHCAEYALREYWGYKPTLQGLQKSKYSDSDWKKMLKDDLKAGRPIIYSGKGDGGGHCFVCDGYDEDEYFHFNWGWGGLYDGFFKLNALAPGTGGTGSGSGSYNDDQQAIFGIEPLLSLDNDETTKDLQLASTITISSSEIAYKEGFSISASVKNNASSDFSGDLGLALYDSGLELLTIIDIQDTTILAGTTINCTFGTEGWSELVAGLYYAAIYSKTSTGEWESIGKGTYRNMVQFRVGIQEICTESTLIYDCDFESELLGWTFAKADGINTGFVVDTAMKYQGNKSLYISPDGGKTAGYTQDNDKGYVSVAYKKIYLEAGSYRIDWRYFYNLKYLDIDNDYYRISIVPASNIIEPLNTYENNPSFLKNSIINYSYSSNYSSWTSDYWNFSITTTGNYYLVYSFIATDKIVNEKGVGIDNIVITKQHPIDLQLTMTETLDGCLFKWKGGYPEYRISWYTECDRNTKRDTLNTNSYLIPYTKLRDIAVGYSSNLYFNVSVDCNENKKISDYSWFYPKTQPFPNDTCPAVPKNLKLEKTDTSLVFSWQGNPGVYDFKYGTNGYGCSWIDTINSLADTTYSLSYEPFRKYIDNKNNSFCFFVRGICPNDTSLWRYGSFSIQWPNACSSNVCWAKPCNLFAQNTSSGIILTWKGNAPKYEIEYRSEDEYYKRGNKYSSVDSNYVRFIANDSTYIIPYGTLSDTLYHFRVRAICGNDTSIWTDYISAYNINFGEYCIPFYDLCGPNTLCTYGSYSSPYSNKKTLDYRQKDWKESYYKGSYNYEKGYRYGLYGWYGYNDTYYRSRHTICFEGEVDPHCDSLLTTVPPGEKYSMRLGNWYNGEGESVTYTHKIDSGYRLILLLKYAVVLQDPSHTSKENPHFTLEILDEKDQLLDSECLFADFAADKNAEGWKNATNAHEPTKEEFRNIVWKDWTTIGINLSDLSKYGDKIIKIRLTTKDCTKGQHFGYAYFTLQCTSADMAGVKCGERPLFFEVAEGFKYRWYLMDDTTKTSVWDQRRFEVAQTDTNSYHVDMISLENDNCFYTLNAYTLPRMPESKAEYTLTPHDCLNEVSFINKSSVYKIMLDGSHELDYRVVIDSVIWDFGKYGKSLEDNPKIIIPNEGDTFNIKLRTVANGCEHIEEFEIKVPAIGDTTTYDKKFIFEGDTLLYYGKEYYKEGVYVDTFGYAYGCDSIHELTIEYYKLLNSKPEPKATFDVKPHDCVNEVFITNLTEVYSYYTEDTVVLDNISLLDSVFWDFGVYGTSTDFTPRLIVPNKGDTFTVKLRTVVDSYSKEIEYELEVPAIEEKKLYTYAEICKGGVYTYEGKQYTDEGEYIVSNHKTIYGCDSTHILVINYLVAHIEEIIDTICFADLPYDFHGQQCINSGTYEHTLQAVDGCDSITHRLNLYIYEKLEIELNELSEICGDDPNFIIPYTLSQGKVSDIQLQFNQFTLNAGFKNFTSEINNDNEIIVTIPDSVRPDTYTVDITFNNHGCESVTLPLEFSILYPSSVIGQRWNDFLSVKNANYNGGYTFTDYQWYLNGNPIEGHKSTQIYEYGKELDFNGEYRVLLTREDDGKSIMSCAFIPIKYNEDEYTELSTLVYTNQIIVANASHAANVKMYNIAGVCVNTYTFNAGYNNVQMPSDPGVYTMQLVYDTEKVQIIKIIVRQ